MTPEALAELRRLLDAATPGPWMVDDEGDDVAVIVDEGAERDDLLAIIDDARHALSADGPKVEPARQVLARALPQITAWQDRTRHARDNTPPHVIAHRGAQLDAVTAERDALTAERDALAAAVERVRALHYRRPHGALDFVAYGQTDFPDLCGYCRTPWPCPTIRALDGAES